MLNPARICLLNHIQLSFRFEKLVAKLMSDIENIEHSIEEDALEDDQHDKYSQSRDLTRQILEEVDPNSVTKCSLLKQIEVSMDDE